jgi:hypothetical protein
MGLDDQAMSTQWVALTIFVAAITSIFVARASEERGTAEDEADQRVEARWTASIGGSIGSKSCFAGKRRAASQVGKGEARETATTTTVVAHR